MKKLIGNKGVTLVALLVTIIILLILAAVSIAIIQKSDILFYANDASYKYTDSKVNEQGTLNEYSNYMTLEDKDKEDDKNSNNSEKENNVNTNAQVNNAIIQNSNNSSTDVPGIELPIIPIP